MQFGNDDQTNYRNHYVAAMYSSDPSSSTTDPYYYDTSSTISPENTSFYDLDKYAQSNNSTSSVNSKGPYQVNRKRPKLNCQKACKKCDDGRPCQRCIKLGLTETCTNSPRKERRKGVKRGPYKKRQYVSPPRYEDGDSQQPLPPNASPGGEWEEQQQAAHTAAAAAAAAFPPLPNPIITPPLSQQDPLIHNSPLTSDAGYYSYPPNIVTTTAAAAAAAPSSDCASCSSPMSPDFPVAGWNDPYLLNMTAPPSAYHHCYNPISESTLIQTLPCTNYEEQYQSILPEEAIECNYYNKSSGYQQQYRHACYPSGESICTSCVQHSPSSYSDSQLSTPWAHHQQHQYPYTHFEQQQNSGYWQSFLSAN
ncbi:hypothetical protein BX666DRAFT_1874548 [Dichotomocladium elegans]|nr:hypothetical protein BX666DRAFT_1874548 [Dichotomocladium elegans]